MTAKRASSYSNCACTLHGAQTAAYEFVRTTPPEHIPFIALLVALDTIAGGIRITGGFVGTPTGLCTRVNNGFEWRDF